MNWILILLLSLAVTSCAPKKEAPLEVVKVTRGAIVASIPTSGIVTPRNRLEIKPPIAGRIEQVLVSEGERVRRGEIVAWMSSSDRAGLLDAARAKGESELRRWEEFYKPTPIIAPIDGFVIQRNVEPGQSFSTSDIVLVMADHLIVKAQVDETDLGRIVLGGAAELVLDAYSEKKIAGEVEHIAFESQVVNNVVVYNVDVRPNAVPPFFRSGMSATVNFSQSEKRAALILPSKAVKKRGKSSYVFQAKKADEKPVPVQVETGLENGDNLEIVSGLAEGDTVVVPTKKMVDDAFARRGGPFQVNPFGGRNQRR